MTSTPPLCSHSHTMAANEDQIPNIYAHRGRYLLSRYHDRNRDVPDHKLSKLIPRLHVPPATPDLPVCIIGAGTAGLYTAMILESLKIPYQIVESNSKDRVGGRLYTYRFSDGGEYDYFVRRIWLYSTLSSDFHLGHWGHAVSGHTIYEADL